MTRRRKFYNSYQPIALKPPDITQMKKQQKRNGKTTRGPPKFGVRNSKKVNSTKGRDEGGAFFLCVITKLLEAIPTHPRNMFGCKVMLQNSTRAD